MRKAKKPEHDIFNQMASGDDLLGSVWIVGHGSQDPCLANQGISCIHENCCHIEQVPPRPVHLQTTANHSSQ